MTNSTTPRPWWRFWPERRPNLTYVVQLHRKRREDGVTLNSWEPIEARTLWDAQDAAWRLRRDNKWGNALDYPSVTIHDSRGSSYPLDVVRYRWHDEGGRLMYKGAVTERDPLR